MRAAKEAKPWLFSLDLKSNFTVEGRLEDGFVHDSPASTTPYAVGGVFWADQNQTLLYSMGANSDPNTPGQSTLQGYDIKNERWQSISVTGGSFNKYNRYYSMHASSFEGGGSQSFLSGGDYHTTGMVVFNAANPTQPSWENVTDRSIPYFWGATTQYVRFGDAGVLVSVGGFVIESTAQTVAQRREMVSIQVYDIAAKDWFTIFATGDIPPPRSRPCSALNAAPDDSSFNMILHGGWDEVNALGDVYVLTMPAFHWIKINTTGSKPSFNPRIDHFCSSVHEDRQILVIGGRPTLDPDHSNLTCSSDYPALRLLDSTTFAWQKNFPLPDPKYSVPQPVIEVIGGSGTGGARPASAFAQTLGDHVSVFSKTIPRYEPNNPPKKILNTTSSTPTTTPSAAPTPPLSSPSAGTIAGATIGGTAGTTIGGIAGATIGGIAGLVVIGVVIWLFLLPLLRKWRRQYKNQNLGGSNEELRKWHKPELSPEGKGLRQGYYTSEMDGEGQRNKVNEIGMGREWLEAGNGTPRPVFELEAKYKSRGKEEKR
ncbi:MAG: hypothetical protein Q9217_001681 [Psora testacea]